jgi:hypothetical protein
MGYGTYLTELLRPLGVYDLRSGSFSGAELQALGAAMDAVAAGTALGLREGVVMTAEDTGLDMVEQLFRYRPAAATVADRRAAIAGLMMVGGDSFTLTALRRCLRGCGVEALVEETDTAGVVRVSFPGIMGVPAGFDRVQIIIEDILPCHLEIDYDFRFVTWGELEDHGVTWGQLEGMTWTEIEILEF